METQQEQQEAEVKVTPAQIQKQKKDTLQRFSALLPRLESLEQKSFRKIEELKTLGDIQMRADLATKVEEQKQFTQEQIDDNLIAVLLRLKNKKRLYQTVKVKKDKNNSDHRRFIIQILYYNQKGRLCTRALKVGRNIVKALAMDEHTFEANRKLYKKILFSSKDFDLDFVEQNGGFFNPHLWDINIAYGDPFMKVQSCTKTIKEMTDDLNNEIRNLKMLYLKDQ